MAKIERVEVFMVDLVPKVKRTDAIQSFVSQETPFVRIFADDGAVGTGYTYTIGTGGHAVVELIARNLAPQLIGRDPDRIEEIWKALFFHTHATAVGAITSLALAAIDTALWDMRCRRSGRPLHVEAGGAQTSVPLYTTEGGWLHHRDRRAGRGRARAPRPPASAAPRSRSGAIRRRTSRGSKRCAKAVGDGFEIMVDGNQGAARRRGDPPRPALRAVRPRLVRGAAAGRGSRRPHPPLRLDLAADRRRRVDLQPVAFPRVPAARRVQRRPGRRGADRRHHALAEDRAPRRSLQRRGLPAFPDGAARRADGRGAERALGRIHPAARQPDHVDEDDDRRTAALFPPDEPGLGIAWDWEAIDRQRVEGLHPRDQIG